MDAASSPDSYVRRILTSGRSLVARVDAHGRLSKVRDLPTARHGDLVTSIDPTRTWVAVTHRDRITLRPLPGGAETVVLPPQGWYFFSSAIWALHWEDHDLFVVPIWTESGSGSRDARARCSVEKARCVVIPTD